MIRELLITKHYSLRLSVVLLLFVIPFMLGSGCSTDAYREDPEALVDTSWELTSIEAIADSAFQQYENGIWEVPDDQSYRLDFEKDGLLFYNVSLNNEGCSTCGGTYTMLAQDSLLIDIICVLDVWCGRKDQEHLLRLMVTNTFEKKASSLHLHYNWPGEMEMKGILHYEKTKRR